jgi:hypothetical protein
VAFSEFGIVIFPSFLDPDLLTTNRWDLRESDYRVKTYDLFYVEVCMVANFTLLILSAGLKKGGSVWRVHGACRLN